jgi:hypothetical protein
MIANRAACGVYSDLVRADQLLCPAAAASLIRVTIPITHRHARILCGSTHGALNGYVGVCRFALFHSQLSEHRT